MNLEEKPTKEDDPETGAGMQNESGVPEVETRSNGIQGYDLVEDPPDGGYGWIVVAAVAVLSVMSTCAFSAVGIFIVEFIEYFNVPKVYVSLIGSLMMAAIAVVGPVLPLVIRRLGCRLVAVLGSFGYSMSLVLASLAPNVPFLILTLGAFTGIFGSSFYIAGQVMVHRYFDKKRALASGTSAGGTAIASIFWPPLTRYLIDVYTWRGASLIMGGICLNGIVAGFLLIPPPKKRVPKKKIPESDGIETCSGYGGFQKILLVVEKKATHILMFFGWFFILAGHNLVSVFIPLRADVFNIPKTKAAVLLSVIGITSGVFRLFASWLGDRPCVRRNLLAGIAASYGGIVTVISLSFTTFPSLLTFVILYGMGGGINSGLQSACIFDVVGIKHISQGFSILFVSMGLSCLIAIPIGGYLYDVTGQPLATVVIFGLVQTFGGICLSCIPFLQDYLRKRSRKTTIKDAKS